ncbi:MAG TPA: aromatic ring-hydroxylating dioxygenase subunit alpha [Chthoniobacteraceae bacterium]|nr:aromatic ring-hydroxylating dioxygenase subunit alpha [Chthoniobacteraceae bacterium]
MPVIDEPQVRAACEFNQRLNLAQIPSHAASSDVAALPAVLGDLEATADRPLEAASTLPAAAYTSDAFYRWEVEHVLRAEWQCVAHVSQLAEAGDFVTLDFLGEPLIIVRDKDRRVRALSRTCPHRGMDIMPPGFGHTPAEPRAGAPGSGHTRLFVCPYHSWTFELDGRLKACAEMHEAAGFEREDCGLREFRSETWHGFIFVNLDGRAARTPAEQWAGVAPHLEKWSSQDLVVVDARSWDCPFNWKVLVENFMESYHHLGAHAQTLQPMMPARDTWTEEERAHYIRCHLPYGAKERAAIGEADAAGRAREIFPRIPELDERSRFEWGLTLGFPHWLLAFVPDCLIWYRVQPEGPHRHTLLTTLLVPRAATRLPDFAERLATATAASVGFHLEDMEMCVGVQRGYYSSGYKRGRLSHLEMPIWLFQRYLGARARGTWPTCDRPAAPAQRNGS